MTSSEVTHPSPSTTLQVEKHLSMLYRGLRVAVKPVRPHLVKASKKYPAGSPKLSSPKTKNGCTVHERQDASTKIWLYDFKAHGAEAPAKNLVLYFAGGGFQSPPADEHWDMVSKLAKRLAGRYAFTIVSPPLAPHSPASECLPVLRKYLKTVCEDAAKEGRAVTLMGDSSGGNLVLSLGFWWAEEVDKMGRVSNAIDEQGSVTGDTSETNPPLDPSTAPRQDNDLNSKLRTVMKSLIVISPAVDHRNTNPDIKKIDQHDPVLGYNLIESVSQAWTVAPPDKPDGASSRSDPKISPLLHPPSSYRLLKELGIKVHGVIGTYDALAPNAELFRLKCVESDVGGDWLIWEGQMHCFVLAGRYKMNEGVQGVDWISQVMERNA